MKRWSIWKESFATCTTMYKMCTSTLRKHLKNVTIRCLLVSRNCKSSGVISLGRDELRDEWVYFMEAISFPEGRGMWKIQTDKISFWQKRNAISPQTPKNKSYAGGHRRCLQVVSILHILHGRCKTLTILWWIRRTRGKRFTVDIYHFYWGSWNFSISSQRLSRSFLREILFTFFGFRFKRKIHPSGNLKRIFWIEVCAHGNNEIALFWRTLKGKNLSWWEERRPI